MNLIDPLSNAVSRLFGLSYLFPYQRLVVTNILEAAEAAGLKLNWPQDEQADTLNQSVEEDLPDGRAVQKEFFTTEYCRSENGLELHEGKDDLRTKTPCNSVYSVVNSYSSDTSTLPDEVPPEEVSDRGSLGRQIVILPTGAGKSLCFQLPAMIIEGPTLVIYPILSLMADQQRRLHERGFAPVTLRGGQSKEERDEIWKKLESGESKFIIANPEVLLTPQVMNRLEAIKIVHIVIDEAHCVSEWGESFRPSYLEINAIIKNVKAPLVTAFTATASAPVLEKIKKYIFGDTEAHQIVGNPDRPNINYTAKGCIVRDLVVRDLLIQNSRPAIVFCSSRPGTQNLARYLRISLGEMGMDWHNEIRFYHAGLSREEKADVEKWFMGNSRAVLCATCAYGMGVDKADVRTVIHRDCAPSVEAYLQESGRAGRDGAQSKAILLWGPDDQASLRRAKTEADRARLTGLLDYARNVTQCRRQALLKMLNYDANGESPETQCCDVCEQQASAALREEASIEDFFRRNKRRYTAHEAASFLAQARQFHWSEREAQQVIDHLIKTGKVKRLKNFLWKDVLST